jgi:hypothetical protein
MRLFMINKRVILIFEWDLKMNEPPQRILQMETGPVPEPFLFNPLKHHARYISGFIVDLIKYPADSDERLKTALLLIGKSQTDLYTGNQEPFAIVRQITDFLEKEGLILENTYMTWLGPEDPGYRKITLTDGSEWVLLPGKIPGRWIHIHPGRYSKYSIRVRAETLKTAIAVIYYSVKHGLDHLDLDVVNLVRTGLLNQSPMKELSQHHGTGRIINLLAMPHHK